MNRTGNRAGKKQPSYQARLPWERPSPFDGMTDSQIAEDMERDMWKIREMEHLAQQGQTEEIRLKSASVWIRPYVTSYRAAEQELKRRNEQRKVNGTQPKK